MDRERRDQDMTMRGSSMQNEGQQMRESYYLAFRMFGEGGGIWKTLFRRVGMGIGCDDVLREESRRRIHCAIGDRSGE